LTRINTISVETLYRYYGKASTSEKDFQSASVSLLFAFYLPYSWIPDKPKKPLLPLYVQDTAEEEKQDAEKQQAQDELNKVQQDILDKRIPSILFEVGKAVILPESYETLDIVGTILKRYPQFSVRVEGHTDDVGSELDNMILSQSRAEAVRKYLIDNFRVTEQKITALGFGETQPIADNESEEGRAKNRRVEFKIIQ
jgi:outer membrane protein OmpA-like peptidoglycan-associated protein